MTYDVTMVKILVHVILHDGSDVNAAIDELERMHGIDDVDRARAELFKIVTGRVHEHEIELMRSCSFVDGVLRDRVMSV